MKRKTQEETKNKKMKFGLFSKKTNDKKTKTKEEIDDNKRLVADEINSKIRKSSDPSETYRKALGFPANLFVSKNAAKEFLELGVPFTQAKKTNNLYWLLAVVAFIVIPFLTLLLKVSMLWGLLVAALISAIIIWSRFNDLHKSYKFFLFERQKDFNMFERLILPLLISVSEGGMSVAGAIKEVGRRMPGANNKRLISRLLIGISDNPSSSEPYTQFAKEFSSTPAAQLFMYSVYRMSCGDFETDSLRNLADTTNKQQVEQTNYIIENKLHRFQLITTRMLIYVLIPIFGFLAAFFISVVKLLNFSS